MQVNTSFQRPIGATQDVAELEYISALAQTGATVREDGSLRDADIMLFLSSRYGIRISKEEVRATVLQGLTTTRSIEGRDYVDLDLMEVVSLLFIPVLLKSAAAAAGKDTAVRPEIKSDSFEIVENDGDTCLENLQLPPPNILSDVLRMILEDVTGNSSPPPLSPDLIKRMLRSYGEIELSEDEQLIKEMVDAALPFANKDVEKGTSVLDENTFAAALTHDVQSYKIGKETSMSTRFADVFSSKSDPKNDDENGEEVEKKVTDKKDLNRVYTAPGIDFTVGTYRSAHLTIALWVTALISYFAYFFSFSTSFVECDQSFEYSLTTPWKNNADKLNCQAGASIVSWFLVFLALGVYGLVFVGLGSIGNFAGCRRWYLPLLGLCVVLFISLWPYALVDTFNKSPYLSNIAFTIAMVTCTFHLSASLGMLLPSTLLDKNARIKAWLSGSAGRAERQIKSAAARKLNLMARNALAITGEAQSGEGIHSSNFHQAVTNYATRDPEYEEIGGFLWVWRHLCNRKIYDEEGIWYSVRLLAANITQYIVACIIIYLGSVFTQAAAEAYKSNAAQSDRVSKLVGFLLDSTISQERVNKMVLSIAGIIATFATRLIDLLLQVEGIVIRFNCTAWADRFDNYCDNSRLVDCNPNITLETLICGLTNSTLDGFERLDLLKASGLDANQLVNVTKENLQQAIDGTTGSVFPAEEYMVTVPVIVGMALAFGLSLSLAVSYLPSITSTILKARCGIIKSLHDKDFNAYRTYPDFVALITGAVFWGNLFASLTFGGIVALVIFFFLWQATVYFALIVTAMLIGVLVSFLIRYIIVWILRCSFWQAFYRTKPAAANLVLLGLEWSNFALSSLFIFIRLMKFLSVAALSVGRIDYPFLSKETSKLGGWIIDRYPHIHFQDLLSHEAHRHPYIELLGTMYLIKLRHGPNFGKRAGSCWRLLFVYALMPWLSKYRAETRPEALEGHSHKDPKPNDAELTGGATDKISKGSEYKEEHSA